MGRGCTERRRERDDGEVREDSAEEGRAIEEAEFGEESVKLVAGSGGARPPATIAWACRWADGP